MSKNILLIWVMLLVLSIAIIPFTSCMSSSPDSRSDNSIITACPTITNTDTTTTQLISTVSATNDPKATPQEYYSAVQKASEQAISINYPYERRTIFLTRDDPAFSQILGFLKESTIQEVTYKPTPEIKGPFPFPQGGYYLTFALSDGSNIHFYNTGVDIRFETSKAYLKIACSQQYWQLLVDTGKRVRLVVSNLPKPSNLTGKIVFQSDRDGNNEIYTMNVDGSELTRLTENAVHDGGPVWSPDGAKIAFVTMVRNLQQLEKLEIFVMKSDGTDLLRLTNGGGNNPAWSPDGKLIVFSFGDIYIMNVDGSFKNQLTNSTFSDDTPDWSPNGKEIVFSSNSDNSNGSKGGKPHVYVININGTDQHLIAGSLRWADTMPKWSPDGSKIVFVSDREHERRKIYLMNSDGTNQMMLSLNHAGEDIHPNWSPDGSKIVFTSTRSGASGIWVMNADGTNQAPLLENSAEKDISDGFPSWWQQNKLVGY